MSVRFPELGSAVRWLPDMRPVSAPDVVGTVEGINFADGLVEVSWFLEDSGELVVSSVLASALVEVAV